MSLKDVQLDTERYIAQYEEGYWDPRDQVMCLAEEVGELAREVNHQFGPKQKKGTEGDGAVGEEIADVIFVLACLANSLHIDLDDAWKKTIHKYSTRDKERYKRKAGDNDANA
jgi:NTP pyrophosphatase (non-canonical NTP hydrolase)